MNRRAYDTNPLNPSGLVFSLLYLLPLAAAGVCEEQGHQGPATVTGVGLGFFLLLFLFGVFLLPHLLRKRGRKQQAGIWQFQAWRVAPGFLIGLLLLVWSMLHRTWEGVLVLTLAVGIVFGLSWYVIGRWLFPDLFNPKERT